ncbi:LacI family transcriptional regulator [Isoptericola sp. CG 20/1183]|uniref:LacI family transcriptional regulator n=1 Tax=Isoptericola halotolerans TaxID=300560 RepID=A0ABX5EHG6_9MICO|nr:MULTISPECIES: LacI family DNA-binding transcriptional regulator [Isoptericola]PRZ02925.1 LacI family transcriptional regulator [Isoptericola sp. CG 20/1183]PRZ09922.1 LacI family transcriptional regulator [Isoptericola halotolerans]
MHALAGGGRRMTRRATLADVARRAGVSVSTASRALHRPGRVSAGTTARVQQAADELGYVPSAAARQVRSGRSGTVALVVPDLTNPFFMALVRGSTRHLREHDMVQVVADVEEEPRSEEQVLEALAGRVDGIVLAASRLDRAALAAWTRRVPLVAINRDVADVPTVRTGTQGVVAAVEHLHERGHRHVAYARGPATSWSEERRRRAVVETCARLGTRFSDLGHHAPRRDAGPAAADAARRSGASALLAYNDLIAFGALDRLTESGVPVPGELSVVGHDDVFGADLTTPALTTVAVPAEELGARAAARLLAVLDGAGGATGADATSSDPGAELPTRLVVRDSTGPAAR